MICSVCGKDTEQRPCAWCEGEPLLAKHYRLSRGSAENLVPGAGPAVDERTGDDVWIAQVELGPVGSEAAQECFESALRLMASATHPALPAPITSTAIERGGADVLVLVHNPAEGETLQRSLAEGPRPAAEVLSCAAGLLDAMVFLHRLSPPARLGAPSPAQLVRRSDGSISLQDLGAPCTALAEDAQKSGDRVGELADLYALGELLLHLSLGSSSRDRNALSGAGTVELPRGLRNLLRDLLEPDPMLRAELLGSARGVRRRVADLLREDEDAPSAPRPVAALPSPAAHRSVAGAVAGVVLTIAGLGAIGIGATVLLLLGFRSSPQEPPPAVSTLVPPISALPALEPQQPPVAPAPVEPPLRRLDVGRGDLPPRGPENAPVEIVVFNDYQCPFCARLFENLDAVQRQRKGEIAVYVRDFPLTWHRSARVAARAVRCADRQGLRWELHDVLLERLPSFEVERAADAEIAEAVHW